MATNSKYQPIAPNRIFELQQSLIKISLPDFPSALTSAAYPHWILWSPTPNNLKNPSKPCTKLLKKPTNPQWQQPDSCMLFDDLVEIYEKRMDYYHRAVDKLVNNPNGPVPTPVGFGFTYTADHPFICVDIDAATDDNNELVQLLNSYTEWSPSNKGLHTIVECESLLEKEHLIDVFSRGKRREKAARDLFLASGYVTVTGNLIPIAPREVRTVPTSELETLFGKYFDPQNKVVTHPKVQQQKEQEADALQRFRDLADADKRGRDDDTSTRAGQDEKSSKGSDEGSSSKGRGKTAKAPLTTTQVKNLLSTIPCQCLEDDIFERLYNDELCVINHDCEDEAREPWLIIGQALHHNFKGRLDGFYLWDAWSQKGNKYDQDASEATWNSFSEQEGQKPVTIAALIKLCNAQRPQFPDRNTKGALKGTLNNFRCYTDFYKFNCYHNEITKDSEVGIPDHVLKRWRIDGLSPGQKLSLPEICEYMITDFIAMGFSPSSYSSLRIKRFLTSMCKTNGYNPIRDYFTTCGDKWDGKDYIQDLINTLELSPLDEHFRGTYKMFLRKWLLQVTAAACHAASHPVRLNRVLIFSGPQNAGKTKWVESLFPKELRKYCAADKEIRISNFRSDNVKQTMELSNTLICNVNEIDRLFKNASFADFKAFLDQTADRIVLPYGDSTTEVTRRTVFIGSTNQERFLKDITGNRRFEIIFTSKLNFKHGIDIEQLWGQIHNLYKGGEKWWFDENIPAEARIIEDRDTINSRTMYIGNDVLIEQLEYIFDVDEAQTTDTWKLYTFKDVRTLLGLSHLTTNGRAFNHAKRALALWCKLISGKDTVKGKGCNPRMYYHLPPVRETEDPLPPEPEEDIKTETTVEDIQKQMAILQEQLKMMKGDE